VSAVDEAARGIIDELRACLDDWDGARAVTARIEGGTDIMDFTARVLHRVVTDRDLRLHIELAAARALVEAHRRQRDG